MCSCRPSLGGRKCKLPPKIKVKGKEKKLLIIFLHPCQSLEHMYFKGKAMYTLMMPLSAMMPPSKRNPLFYDLEIFLRVSKGEHYFYKNKEKRKRGSLYGCASSVNSC